MTATEIDDVVRTAELHDIGKPARRPDRVRLRLLRRDRLRPPLPSGRSPEQAIAEQRRCAGTQVDSKVVDAFVSALAGIEKPDPATFSP